MKIPPFAISDEVLDAIDAVLDAPDYTISRPCLRLSESAASAVAVCRRGQGGQS